MTPEETIAIAPKSQAHLLVVCSARVRQRLRNQTKARTRLVYSVRAWQLLGIDQATPKSMRGPSVLGSRCMKAMLAHRRLAQARGARRRHSTRQRSGSPSLRRDGERGRQCEVYGETQSEQVGKRSRARPSLCVCSRRRGCQSGLPVSAATTSQHVPNCTPFTVRDFSRDSSISSPGLCAKNTYIVCQEDHEYIRM